MRRNSVLILAAAVVVCALVFASSRSRHAPAVVMEAGPPLGRVTVGVYDEGAPLPGRWVVFHDPDGGVRARMKSGVDGKATADIPEGGMITVAHGESIRHLVTFTDVHGGDEIVVGEKDEEEKVATSVGSANVRLPSAYPGAARYVVTLGVGPTPIEPAAPVKLPVLDRFIVEGHKFKALAEALDEGGRPIAYAFAWGAWKDAAADVDVTLGAWSKGFRSFDVELANAPSAALGATGTLSIFSKDEDRFDRSAQASFGGEHATTLRFLSPPELGNEAQMRIAIAFADSADGIVVVRREEELARRTVVDLAKGGVPRVSAATATAAPASAARPIVRWSAAGDPTRADAIIARASWPETREHVWTIVMPPTAKGSVQLPALPEELRDWRPDGRPLVAAAAIVEASFYDGYADVRKKGIGLIGEPPEDEHGAVTLVYSVTGELHL